jgi:ABC-type transport system substrate-binding protein
MSVVDDVTKKRFRRQFRKKRQDVIGLSLQADEKIESLLIRRFERLISVRRFVFLWLSLFVLLAVAGIFQIRSLSSYYQSLQPIPGGLYSEGLIGTFTNANPIYATGAADVSVSHLVFSGLFKYDNNNTLAGDLATDYKLDDSQTLYTVNLRHNVKWQDGAPFTADDVVFTYKTIQDISAQSML